MARKRKLLPLPHFAYKRPKTKTEPLTASYKRLANAYKKAGLDRETANEYALMVQQQYSLYQRGYLGSGKAGSRKLTDFFYIFVYDDLKKEYGIDMHSPDFYPRRSK